MNENLLTSKPANIWEHYDYLENEIKVTMISDVLYEGNRVTTMLWRVPRFLLPQLNTYRAFSRNVASNRAKRFSITSDQVWRNPYIPYIWQKDHKGMQGEEQLEEWKLPFVNMIWKLSSLTQVMFATWLDRFGVSKQYTNRMIEGYMYVDYLVTSTNFEHFLLQRDSYHAQLEIQVLARRVKTALKLSTPLVVKPDTWVLPFVSQDEREKYTVLECIKFSVARCARVSYQTQLGGFEPNNDYKLANRLANDGHFSPFEHQIFTGKNNGGNLKGVTQLRKILEEVIIEADGVYSEVNLREKIYVDYTFNPISSCGGSCLRCSSGVRQCG